MLRRTSRFFLGFACLSLVATWGVAPAQANEPVIHSSNAGVAASGSILDQVTITNGDLGSGVITVDALISRTEASGGDTWFGTGVNSAGGTPAAIVTGGNVGWLSRARTDSGTAHQLFDAPGTKGTSGSDLSGVRRTISTISLASNGINSGDLADVVVRYDENNDGSVDYVLGGSFDWTANSANFDLAAHNKAYNYDVTIASGTTSQFSIFDTGVDDNGAVLAPGAADPHWDITNSPGGPVGDATVQNNHPAWLANDAAGTVGGTSWISTVAGGQTPIAEGDYVFAQTFNLNGFDPDTAVLALELAVDNSVSDILLNGNSTGISHSGFADFSGVFEIDSGFVGGENTIEFLMTNAGNAPGPGGLRVNFLQATATVIPEPASIAIWSLIGLGCAGFGWLRWKKQRAA